MATHSKNLSQSGKLHVVADKSCDPLMNQRSTALCIFVSSAHVHIFMSSAKDETRLLNMLRHKFTFTFDLVLFCETFARYS